MLHYLLHPVNKKQFSDWQLQCQIPVIRINPILISLIAHYYEVKFV